MQSGGNPPYELPAGSVKFVDYDKTAAHSAGAAILREYTLTAAQTAYDYLLITCTVWASTQGSSTGSASAALTLCVEDTVKHTSNFATTDGGGLSSSTATADFTTVLVAGTDYVRGAGVILRLKSAITSAGGGASADAGYTSSSILGVI